MSFGFTGRNVTMLGPPWRKSQKVKGAAVLPCKSASELWGLRLKRFRDWGWGRGCLEFLIFLISEMGCCRALLSLVARTGLGWPKYETLDEVADMKLRTAVSFFAIAIDYRSLVAEWIHFTLFGIILPTKLKVYTLWGL